MRPSPFQRLSSVLSRNLVFTPWIWREHPAYLSFKRELDRSQYYSVEHLRELQLARLNALLAYARQNCPFYRIRLEQAGLRRPLESLEELQALPFTTKRDIQDHGVEMRSHDDSAHPVRNQTGGSTGSPVQFYVDRLRFGTRLATAYRTDEWAGLRPGDWHAYLWGASLDLSPEVGWWPTLRNHLLRRRIELNTSSVSEKDWSVFLAKLRRFRPEVFVAYAQAAVLFAQYVRDRNIPDIRFKSVITTAEVCSAEDRRLIEEVFGAKVFNRYGCREVSTIGAECVRHTGLHVSAESLFVEVVPQPDLPEGTGKIIVTDLLNRSMPLLRYEIGDVGSWAAQQECACGRKLPLLSGLEGRLTDFLTLLDGSRVSGVALLTWVFASMDEVRQVQFIQHAPGDMTLKYVPGPQYGANTENNLRQRLRPYLHEQTHLTLELVQQIAKEQSGKFRFILHAPRATSTAKESVTQ